MLVENPKGNPVWICGDYLSQMLDLFMTHTQCTWWLVFNPTIDHYCHHTAIYGKIYNASYQMKVRHHY